MLPDPAERPTLDAAETAAAYGIGLTLVRQEGRRYIASGGAEGIPCVAFGRCLRFPTAAVRRQLLIDDVIETAVVPPPAEPEPALYRLELVAGGAGPEQITPRGRPRSSA